MDFSSVIFVLILFNNLFIFNSVAIDFELELLQVLFRHGDRTPEKYEIYNTDPYDPDYYEPIGYGQLIKPGKQRLYKMGRMLRKRYDAFLGEFNVDEVYAYSTDYDRTKMSLHLALAGMYPPSQKTFWSEEIYWSPIPTYYDGQDDSFLNVDLFGQCTNYGQYLHDAEKSPEIQKKMEKYKDFIEYVKNKTEFSDVNPFGLLLLYSNLNGVKSMGLPLPIWCSEEDFNMLYEIAAIAFETTSYTEQGKKIMAGLMIEKFLGNTKANGRRKVYMYSGHDVGISAFIRAHNLTAAPKVLSYGSAIIMERLRGSNGQTYLRMLLWTGDTEQIIPLNLDKCSNECLLENYENIIRPMILTDSEKKCFSKHDQDAAGSDTVDVLYKRYFSEFKYSKNIKKIPFYS